MTLLRQTSGWLLVALLLFLALTWQVYRWLWQEWWHNDYYSHGPLVLLVSLSGVWICRQASARLGVHDHPGIVWDEVAGFLITMIPAFASWIWVIPGFVLFRLFDIWKPWPISWADRQLKGGLGIMLDDVLAGGIAAGILYIVIGWLG